MAKDKQVLEVHVNIDAVASASRNNSGDLSELALELDTVNPRELTLDQEIFTLKVVPVNDKVKGKKLEFAPKTVGIRALTVNSLANVKEGMVTINGTIDVVKEGRRVLKLEQCLFDNMNTAMEVAKVICQVELEKAEKIRAEATEAVNFLKKQIEDNRF